MDAFKAVHWNLTQVAAWVCLRDRDLVGLHSDSCEEEPLPAQVTIMAMLRSGEASTAWSDAQNQIIVALQKGEIHASGVRVGMTVRAEIDVREWADLHFKFDPDQATVANAQGISEPRWEKLRFNRAEIVANWPEFKAENAAAEPPDITDRELRAWIKHDTWTAGEAMLLLHGKTPRNPWLRNDELTTHFSEAKRYLDRALQSGTIGERRHADVQEQWIDTPTRWHEWASGEIPVPPVVQTAFLEHRYATAPRVHYVRAKRRLQEKIPCRPEEIAMWLFTEELMAWHGDEPESRRFVFLWIPGDDYDYVTRLTDLYFSVAQLEELEPDERWMTHQEILDRWAKSMTTTEAVDLIISRAGTADLSAAHPLMGLPREDDGATVEDCMLPRSRIERVEASIGIDSHRTATGLISAQNECRGWLEGLMRDGPREKAKPAYWAECRDRFPGLSVRSFEFAWKQAIANTGKVEWSKPGRISKRRIDTPK